MRLRVFTGVLLLAAQLLTAAANVCPASANPLEIAGLRGTLQLKSMPESPILHRKITTWIYLPPGYDQPENSTSRYPVIYLLHGQPGSWTDCFRSGEWEKVADSLISEGLIRPVILIAFDGNGPGGTHDMTEFCNRPRDDYRLEDFIVQEMVPYVDSNYRSLPDATHRVLMGYSGGGFGALNLGLHHPDVWKILVSHAGFYQPSDDARTMTAVLGPQQRNRELWARNSPLLAAHQLTGSAGLHVYMDDSPQDEDYAGFQALSQTLRARGVDLLAVSCPNAHSWKVVTKNSRESLQFANRSFPEDH